MEMIIRISSPGFYDNFVERVVNVVQIFRIKRQKVVYRKLWFEEVDVEVEFDHFMPNLYPGMEVVGLEASFE